MTILRSVSPRCMGSQFSSGTPSGFSLTADGEAVALSAGDVTDDTITYTTAQIYSGAALLLSYTGSDIEDAASNALAEFSDSVVVNNSTVSAATSIRGRRFRSVRRRSSMQSRRSTRRVRRGY